MQPILKYLPKTPNSWGVAIAVIFMVAMLIMFKVNKDKQETKLAAPAKTELKAPKMEEAPEEDPDALNRQDIVLLKGASASMKKLEATSEEREKEMETLTKIVQTLVKKTKELEKTHVEDAANIKALWKKSQDLELQLDSMGGGFHQSPENFMPGNKSNRRVTGEGELPAQP